VLSWVAVVPALAVLVPIWGVEGVAAAMSVSSAVSCFALLYLLHRSENERALRNALPPATTVPWV
jgi:Na+-driven multidrug efflux pump